MGRPKVGVPRRILLELYVEQRLSLRECARRLGVSKWLVIERLAASGVQLREHDEAVDLQRYLEESPHPTGCVYPDCDGSRGPLCGRHWRAVRTATRAGRCAWRDCTQAGTSGWCTYHGKRVTGLIA